MSRSKKTKDARSLGSSRAVELGRRVHRAHARLISHAAHIASTHDVESSELSMLNVLGLRGPMRMGDVAERMILGAASMTRLAKGLEAKGLVRRERSPHSNREVIVRLTEQGETKFQEAFDELVGRHDDYFSMNLSAAEQDLLLDLLDRLPLDSD